MQQCEGSSHIRAEHVLISAVYLARQHGLDRFLEEPLVCIPCSALRIAFTVQLRTT